MHNINSAYTGLNSGGSMYVEPVPIDNTDSLPKASSVADIASGNVNSDGSQASPSVVQPVHSAYVRSPSTPQKVEFIDAPFAEHYGMNKATAYQEALANTAYQRKVEDLKKAGLNPVLGVSGSGAASFYGSDSVTGYGSSGSGRSTSDLAGTASRLSFGLPSLINGVTNFVVTYKTGNPMSGYGAGMIAQNIVSGALNLIKNFG